MIAASSSSSAVPPRKLVIKPLKTKPKLPENFEDDTWAKLQAAVRAVHAKQAVRHSLEELYRAVEDLCLHSMAARAHERLQRECEAHIDARLTTLVQHQTPDSQAFLALVDGCWRDHCEQMLTIRSVFLYLDRTHVMQSAAKKSLWDMGLQLFRAHLERRPEVVTKTVAGLLLLIEKERNGDQVERGLLHSLLRMYHDLGLYPSEFEGRFVDATTRYYAAEAEARLAATDVPTYLRHVDGRLAAEEARVQHYLQPATRRPLRQAAVATLLAAHVDAILEKGFVALMDASRVDDLKRMYHLFSLVGAHATSLRTAWSKYVKKVGAEMVGDVEREKNLVTELLGFKARLDAVHGGAFESHELFAHSLKEGFECFINTRQNKPAELVARYIDGKLRAGNKGTSDEELEDELDRAMTLFR